jgi:hypothetical protein
MPDGIQKIATRDLMDLLTVKDIRRDWKAMPDERKRWYKIKAAQQLALIPFVESDIKNSTIYKWPTYLALSGE